METVLQEHFETASRNATYVSKTIQNEMITTAGKYIKDQLTAEIRASKYFSVIADEATDVSNKENLSLVIRFVDSTQTIREEFVGFHLCEEGTSGRAIKNVITNAVADLGLNMNDCRGQCYDGAGNMAGRLNGASTLIKEDYNKAIYFHCMNHRLNLCIADTCSYQLVRDMMATVRVRTLLRTKNSRNFQGLQGLISHFSRTPFSARKSLESVSFLVLPQHEQFYPDRSFCVCSF